MPSRADLTILLTGANGQLGRQLLQSLKPVGRLVAVVRPGSDLPAGLEIREADLAYPDEIRHLVRSEHPDWIVNAAAYTAVDAAENDRDVVMAVNGVVPGVLAEEAARLGAMLIHFSTDYVFSGAGARPWRETDLPRPVNFYGQSKLVGEEAIRRTDATHWILRTSWLYGTGGQNFVGTMLQLAAERAEIAVVDDQIGAPTSAGYVAAMTRDVLVRADDDLRFAKANCGTFHLACSGETSWYGVATEIFALASELGLNVPTPTLRPIPSAEYISAAKRPLNSRLDTSRLRERFGLFAPQWDVELRAQLPSLLAQCGQRSRI